MITFERVKEQLSQIEIESPDPAMPPRALSEEQKRIIASVLKNVGYRSCSPEIFAQLVTSFVDYANGTKPRASGSRVEYLRWACERTRDAKIQHTHLEQMFELYVRTQIGEKNPLGQKLHPGYGPIYARHWGLMQHVGSEQITFVLPIPKVEMVRFAGMDFLRDELLI